MENMSKKSRMCITSIVLLIICAMMLPLFIPTVNAADASIEIDTPTEKEIIKQISNTYKEALHWWGKKSFAGWCAHYVNLQLMFRGINTSYVGGNGNTEYDNYKNMEKTTGGRIVHAYPTTSAQLGDTLRQIASEAPVVTDVLVGFDWSSTTAGRKYGHVFLIHAIIDGYVYFSDNYSVNIGGKSYKEGQPIKCTIDELVAHYGRKNIYGAEGIIWFEDPELTDAQCGASNETMCYRVTSALGLKLRSGPGIQYSILDKMLDGTELSVLEVSEDGWGRVLYNGIEGWCSLEYCTFIPPVTDTDRNGALYRVNYWAGLRLRSGPSTQYKTLLTMPNKTLLDVLEISPNGWAHVTYDGVEGWCSLDYCVLIEPVVEPDANTPVYIVNYETGLRLRSGPGTQHSRIVTIPNETELSVLEISDNGWGRVIYNGLEGWCSLAYCIPPESDSSAPSTYYEVDVHSGLRLRSGPGTEHKELLRLPNGYRFEIIEASSNGWAKIDYNGTVGWCSLDYCVKVE